MYFLYFLSPSDRVISKLPCTRLRLLWTMITPPWLSTRSFSSSFEARCSLVMSLTSFLLMSTAFESPALAKYSLVPRKIAQSAVLPPLISPDSKICLSALSKAMEKVNHQLIETNLHSFKAIFGSSLKLVWEASMLWKFFWRKSLTLDEVWPSYTPKNLSLNRFSLNSGSATV